MNVVTLLFGTFGLMLLLGAPITLALGVASMSALYFLGNDLVYLVQVAYTSVDSFPIMALPAFILAGALMEYAGISKRLVNVAEARGFIGKGGDPWPRPWPVRPPEAWPAPRCLPVCFSVQFPDRARPPRLQSGC